jgi:NodT family efflux transporter outer membrane factor (OMF) lipoprotein
MSVGGRRQQSPDRKPFMMGQRHRRTRAAWWHPALLMLHGLWLCRCAVGPDFHPPEPPAVQHYTQGEEPAATVSAAEQTQYFEMGEKIAGDWWRLFRSIKLNTVIQEAIVRNQDLQAAQARLRQSRETLWAGYGGFLPQFDGQFDATRQKFSAARFGGTFFSTIFTLYTATATVSYNLDVFGRTRRTVEGLRARMDYQAYEAQATYLSLVGNVVQAVIAQASFRAQIEATKRIISFEQEQLKVVEAQAKAGKVPMSDVLSVRAQLAATEATLPPLRQSLDQSGHLLATLVGRLPAEWAPPVIELTDLTLPTDLPVSLPSQLVRQRPDIMASESQLHVASADIGVATAALFPSITLSGAYGQNSTDIHALFDKTSNFWSLGAGLTAPLLHGGSLWFQRRAALEAYQVSLANYRQTVLSAFAQVADTLRALEHDAETLKAQSEALESSERALHLVQARYRAGIASYLQLLDADRQFQQARIGYLQSEAQRLQDTAALFAALGGGWWVSEDWPPESSSAVRSMNQPTRTD